MSEANYINHPIRASVTQLDEILGQDQFSEVRISGDETYAFARDKVLAVCKLLKEYLSHTPAVLASVHGLNLIQTQLQQIITELNAYQSNTNLTHLINAANIVDQTVAQQLWAFLPDQQNFPANTMVSITEQLRQSAIKTISKLTADEQTLEASLAAQRDEISRQNERLSGLTETVAAQKAEALSVSSQVRAEYTEKETQRISEFSSTLEGFKTTFNALKTETHSERETLISELKKQIRDNEELAKQEREALTKQLQKKFEEYENDTKRQRDALIESLKKSQEETARIVAVVGNNAITGRFQVTADTEAKQADTWRNITIACFAIGVTMAIVTFVKFVNGEASAENILSAAIRLLYAIAITAPAWYAAKESARHRSNSDRARQTELELTSLGPYIELMTDEKKTLIRENLIDKYFGRDIDPHEVSDSLSSKDIKELLLEAVKKRKE
jgi:hypothetical protein